MKSVAAMPETTMKLSENVEILCDTGTKRDHDGDQEPDAPSYHIDSVDTQCVGSSLSFWLPVVLCRRSEHDTAALVFAFSLPPAP